MREGLLPTGLHCLVFRDLVIQLVDISLVCNQFGLEILTIFVGFFSNVIYM